MPEGTKKPGAAGKTAKAGKSDKRRLSYLKMRGLELKKEMQANRKESEEIRTKLGLGVRKKKNKSDAGGGDDED